MTTIGPNVKLTVHPQHQGAIRRMLGEGLGLPRQEMGPWDLFTIGDGGTFGVLYAEHALTPEQARLGAWLEFEVADVDATLARLGALGFAPFADQDESRNYFSMPGGQVFRLATPGSSPA